MDIKAALLFILSMLILGIVIFLPLWWLARRFTKVRPLSTYSQPMAKKAIGYQSIFVILLFIGFGSEFYAPESVIGKLVSNQLGLIIFTFSIIGLNSVISRVLVFIARRRYETVIRKKVDEFSVDRLSDVIVDDESLAADQAFCVEFFNDDVTKMEFVISVLHTCFGLGLRDAVHMTMDIHNGKICKIGRLTHENALQLSKHIKQQAAKYDFPFRCEVKPFNS